MEEEADDEDEAESSFMEGYEGLGEASGLDTTPEIEFETSSGFPTMDSSAYHTAVRKAAELLDLDLPSKEVKSNLLTEVLIPSSAKDEPILPFHVAVAEPVLQAWEKPASAAAVNRGLSRRYRVASGDPVFLSSHPTPESLVIQASCSGRGVSFPTTPTDRESKKS